MYVGLYVCMQCMYVCRGASASTTHTGRLTTVGWVLACGAPSAQALSGGILTSRPLLRRGVAGTKVHGLATGCGRRVNGLRCPLPCLACVSAGLQHAHSSTHTALVDLTEVGSMTLWAFASGGLPVGFCVLAAGWGLYEPALASVAVDSTPGRPRLGHGRLNRATVGWPKKKNKNKTKKMYVCMYVCNVM